MPRSHRLTAEERAEEAPEPTFREVRLSAQEKIDEAPVPRPRKVYVPKKRAKPGQAKRLKKVASPLPDVERLSTQLEEEEGEGPIAFDPARGLTTTEFEDFLTQHNAPYVAPQPLGVSASIQEEIDAVPLEQENRAKRKRFGEHPEPKKRKPKKSAKK